MPDLKIRVLPRFCCWTKSAPIWTTANGSAAGKNPRAGLTGFHHRHQPRTVRLIQQLCRILGSEKQHGNLQMTNFRPLYIFLAALAVITAYVVYDAKYNYVNWRTANRSSAGIAPSPLKEKEAVVQVYAARTYSWRGAFAVHSWVAVKPENAKTYTIYQVMGWYLRRGLPAVSVTQGIPDRRWYRFGTAAGG